MKNYFNRYILTILYVRYIQYRYKKITMKNISYRQSNQNIARLTLLQAKEYYYFQQFSVWGKFHYDCVWFKQDQQFINWLFPLKDFEEFPTVLWHHPKAITYYRNRIFGLTRHSPISDVFIKDYIRKERREDNKHYNL